MDVLRDYLAEHPFLSDVADDHVVTIQRCASITRLLQGDYLFREGQPANQFFLIRQGNVALQVYAPRRGAITIETAGAGDVVGWSWLVPPYLCHFDARATELTRAIAIDAVCLRDKVTRDVNLGSALMERFAAVMMQRLQATRLQLVDMYGSEEFVATH